MSPTMFALLGFALAGLMVVPIGLLVTWLERRAARGPHNTPAE